MVSPSLFLSLCFSSCEMGTMFIIACAYPAQTLLEVSVSIQGGEA